jgi:hypothetical protein
MITPIRPGSGMGNLGYGLMEYIDYYAILASTIDLFLMSDHEILVLRCNLELYSPHSDRHTNGWLTNAIFCTA